MKKLFIMLVIPMIFLLCGASMENYNVSIGPCFMFPIENNSKTVIKKIKKDENTIHKEFKVEAGKTLKIDLNSGGSISITGWDKNLFSADVESTRDNLEDYDIDFKESGNGIEIESKLTEHTGSSGGLHFILKIPSQFNLQVKTMGGPVKIDNVEGEINGQTMGGPLEFSNLKGNLDFETMGGPIKLYNSEVDGKVHTMGGPVEITNVKGNVKGTTNGGPVIMKNVSLKEGSSSSGAINISSMGGDINVDEAPAGADVKTMGGKITVKTAKRFVNARTNGGDIIIKNTDGVINASTMGGDIEAEMVGSTNEGNKEVNLSSNSGDIALTVPADFSMDIDITLAYTKKGENRYNIYSDFPLDQQTTSDWNDKKGSPRKYIYGKGKTGTGKNKVTIETINGNIYLKKGK